MNNSQKKADGAVLKELAQAYGDEAKARELLESWRWPEVDPIVWTMKRRN